MAMRINNNIAALNALRHLNATDRRLSSSLEKLSSGQRINKASDDPAALVISEQMRAQIKSLEQAMRNSETSISMVQTAEGALNEVSNILVSIRQLAIHAANEGANDIAMLQADQSEIDNLLNTLSRISNTTQFGTRNLLDGSNATSGVTVGDGLEFVKAAIDTKPSSTEGYKINITKVATRAMVVASRSLNLEEINSSFVVSEGGRTIALDVSKEKSLRENIEKIVHATKGANPMRIEQAKSTIQHLIANKLQQQIDEAGMEIDVFLYKTPAKIGDQIEAEQSDDVTFEKLAEIPHLENSFNKEEEIIVFRHRNFGSKESFSVTTNNDDLFGENTPRNRAVHATKGRDIEGTIGGNPEFEKGEAAIGVGQFLTAAPGTEAAGLTVKYNRDTDDVIFLVLDNLSKKYQGIYIKENTDEILIGDKKPSIELSDQANEHIDGYAHVSQNSLAFQVGPNKGQQVKISLQSTRPKDLGKGLDNESNIQNLGDISVLTSRASQDSIAVIDKSIEDISTLRATLGSFQKNALESNLNSLTIATENLTSAESELRDSDMALEMSSLVKNQILLQAGTSMLAQANQIPNSVLTLLNQNG